MIGRLIRVIFKSVYTLIAFFALLFSGLLFYFGPSLGWGEFRPFGTFVAQALWVAIIWVIAIATMLAIFLLRRGRDRKMTEEIIETQDTSDEAITTELGDMRGKLREAMAALRKTKGGRRHLYELPWYVMIGPPGAGKTTAIVNSGLRFPLAETMGKGAIGGVGGTRNCDWWFTDNAVMIDTAGRYTTQESDAESDNAGWLGFLGLLKKYRKRQPINGAIVAISLSDLSMQDEITQKSHAAAIRRRLHELRDKLGVRFPVYILFTKADLVAGFVEFFDDLGKEERGQVWGFTFPLEKSRGEVSPIKTFDEEFSALLGQLNAQSLEKMQAETDHQRRSLIAGFPSQVASVRQIARDFLAEVFQDNRYEQRHMLRGIYFASGTQEGTPIDRLMMSMARTFGIGRQAIGSGQGAGRSFFLTRLFDDVIFKEGGLVSADDKVERRYRWGVRLAMAATVILVIAIGTLWTRSFLGNRDLIAQAAEVASVYGQAIAAVPASPIGDTDMPGVVPALNVLRDMPTNPAGGDVDVDGRLTWGLYQGRVTGTGAAQAYRSALNQHLLPRLLLRLEEQMQSSINQPDMLFEALKVYLMLGQQGPMNSEFVQEWMMRDWEAIYAGVGREQLRVDLAGHLEALLGQPMIEIALNGPLIEQVQQVLTEMPLAQRVYNGIINSPAAKELPPWRVTEVGGPAVARVMVRSSGKPLNEGIEGIFTYRGFNTVFLEAALTVSTRVQREAWVLGPNAADMTELALLAMSRDVMDLYYNDFIQRYDTLLADLDITPLQSLSHAVEVTNVLSGPTSPIFNILNAVAEETRLTEDRSSATASAAAEAAGSTFGFELRRGLSPTAQVFLSAMQRSQQEAAGGVEPPAPGAYVEQRFEWLQRLVDRPEGQSSQLDLLLGTLQEVYNELNRLAFSGGLASLQQGGDASAIARFQLAVANLPGPLQRWATQIAAGSSGVTAGGTRASIDAQWQSEVLPFCEQALSNRYPFTRNASADVAMADFARIFGPNGLIDSFVSQNLAQYIDTRSRPWTWKPVNGADLGISPTVLQQIENAAQIRDAFFASGGPTPSVSFQMTPEALDPNAQAVTLSIDGTRVRYAHSDGQPGPTAVTWPGAVGQAQVVFEPSSSSVESGIARDGPWAWFRLLNAAEVRPTNVSDRTRVVFNVGGRIAIFQMQSGSVLNPFALAALSRFSCPTSF